MAAHWVFFLPVNLFFKYEKRGLESLGYDEEEEKALGARILSAWLPTKRNQWATRHKTFGCVELSLNCAG